MSEERTSRNPGEPGKAAPGGVERWADYLEWLREDIVTAVLALSAAEQRASNLPSGWSPLELLNHCLHMEQRWFVWGFLGEPVAEPWGDWNVRSPGPPTTATRHVPRRAGSCPPATAEELATRLRALGERTRSILRGHPLDTPGAAGGRFGDDPPTLEWICFHVLAEYARHAGHLDVSTEITRG